MSKQESSIIVELIDFQLKSHEKFILLALARHKSNIGKAPIFVGKPAHA
jgi:hypothetical protein